MMKRIVHTRPDGGISVESPAPELVTRVRAVRRDEAEVAFVTAGLQYDYQPNPDGTMRPLSASDQQRLIEMFRNAAITDENIALEIIKIQVIPPTHTDVLVCDYADIYPPTKSIAEVRRFRNCWRRLGMALPHVDMPLARLQRMNEVRVARTPKLTKSDADLLRALEGNDPVLRDRLKVYRQALRDLPATEQPNVDAITTPEQLDAWRPTWPTDPVP